VEFTLDIGQGDVDDGHVEQQHESRDRDKEKVHHLRSIGETLENRTRGLEGHPIGST